MAPMAAQGEEAVGSMGNDSPLAVLSNKNKTLYNYFKQLFAQVTNPPIDPIRENMVMSLVSFIGPKPNLLDTNNINPPMRLEVSQPVLDFKDIAKIRAIDQYTGGKFSAYELNICYPVAWGKEGIEARLASLCAEAVDAVKSGYNILIVSDRKTDADHVAIPALLATSAIHQHLVQQGLRTSTAWSSRPAPRARRTTSRCSPATARSRAPVPGDGNAREDGRRPAGRPVAEKAIYNFTRRSARACRR
jgi:glutamate synthase (NADPH/NADH) large chain/glutamate synthase (ferredoxin)